MLPILDIFLCRYFVPGDQSHDFLDFGSESLEKLDTALESRFQMLIQSCQGSKTSTYNPQDLEKHINRQPPGTQAHNLRKALEEIAVSLDYNPPQITKSAPYHT